MFAVRGSFEGYDYMVRQLNVGRSLDTPLCQDIHERTALDLQPRARGSFRTVPVLISGSSTQTSSPALLREHCDDVFFHLNQSQADAVTKAAAFHAMFEKIHPFRDANGRTGRILP